MFFFGLDGSWMSKVYLDPFTHDQLAIKDLFDPNTGLLIKKCNNYAAKALEWCPRVYRRRSIDELFDGLYVVGTKDERVVEVGNEEGI